MFKEKEFQQKMLASITGFRSETNKAILSGIILEDAEFSHFFYKAFYKIKIAVSELSGTIDIIELLCSKDCDGFDLEKLKTGNTIRVTGKYNTCSIDGRKKILLMCESIKYCNKPYCFDINVVRISGKIIKPVVYRNAGSNREITDIMVEVKPSKYRSDYIPCVAWLGNARFVAKLNIGDKVVILGHMQSREYVKWTTGEKRRINELAIDKIKLVI